MIVFCHLDNYVDRSKSEENRREGCCSQSTTSEPSTENMTQQRERRIIRKVIEVAKGGVRRLPIYLATKVALQKMTNSTSTDVTFEGA